MRQVQPSQPPEALKQFPKTVENITCCPGVKSLQVQVGGMDVVTMAMIDMIAIARAGSPLGCA